MKKLFFIFTLLILASCEEEVQMYSKLTQAERDSIRDFSAQKCRDEVTPKFISFKKESAKVFDSKSYDRERGFYFEYKSGTDVKKKMNIRIWKRDEAADELYFYITETQLATESYFLKITRVQNEEMIDDILEDLCVRTPARIYDGSVSSTSMSIKYEYGKSNAPNTDEYLDTYSLPYSSLAMFANFRLTRKVTTKKSDGSTVGSPVNYTSTLTSKNYDFEGHTDATSGQYTQKFCVIAPETTGPDHYKFSKESTFLGFKTACTTGAVPGDWDLVIP